MLIEEREGEEEGEACWREKKQKEGEQRGENRVGQKQLKKEVGQVCGESGKAKTQVERAKSLPFPFVFQILLRATRAELRERSGLRIMGEQYQVRSGGVCATCPIASLIRPRMTWILEHVLLSIGEKCTRSVCRRLVRQTKKNVRNTRTEAWRRTPQGTKKAGQGRGRNSRWPSRSLTCLGARTQKR